MSDLPTTIGDSTWRWSVMLISPTSFLAVHRYWPLSATWNIHLRSSLSPYGLSLGAEMLCLGFYLNCLNEKCVGHRVEPCTGRDRLKQVIPDVEPAEKNRLKMLKHGFLVWEVETRQIETNLSVGVFQICREENWGFAGLLIRKNYGEITSLNYKWNTEEISNEF